MLKRLYDWLGKQVHSPYAVPLLALLFYIEAIFLFIPVDPILMLYCIEFHKRSYFYAFVATISSVLGGITAYYIGAALWETIGQTLVSYILSQETFDHAVDQFREHQNWAVIIGGFTPVPYKAVTLSAGFCKLPLIPFIINSLISRGARFFLVAGIIAIWGKQMKVYIDRYFNILAVLFVILVGLSMWLLMK